MRLLLISLLLFPLLLFAQYGANIAISNNSFETHTGTADDGTSDTWTDWTLANQGVTGSFIDATTTAYSGSKAIKLNSGSSAQTRAMGPAFVVIGGKTYRTKAWTTGDGAGHDGLIRWYDMTNSAYVGGFSPTGVTGTSYVQVIRNITTPATCVSLKIYVFAPYQGLNRWSRFDLLSISQKLDSIYIATTGNDANQGTSASKIATLTEAFETRGAHAGGVFVTTAGTYNEEITIDSSFSRWISSGGEVNVTSVDFANKTCSVDYCIYKNIGTISNAGNVTILYTWCDSLATPALTSPTDLATGLSLTPTLDWNAVTRADSYFVKLSANPLLTSPLFDATTELTAYPVSGLSNSTIYYWSVAAKNEVDTSFWADTISFTTKALQSTMYKHHDVRRTRKMRRTF